MLQEKYKDKVDRRGGLVVERSPCMQETGIRSPVGTNQAVKTDSDRSTIKRLAKGVSVTGSRNWP